MPASLLVIALVAAHPGAIAARVGAQPVTAAEVVARAHAARVTPELALDALVREALLAVAARADGLADDPQVVARVEAERRRLAVEQLMKDEVFSKVEVSDAEVAEAFHAQDEVRLSMVVRETEEEARGVLERLRAGAGIIEESRASIDPVGRARSGVMGSFKRSELEPGLARAAFVAPVNQPAGPAAVTRGFAVFVVHERKVGTDATLRDEAPRLLGAMEQARREELAARLLAELRKRQKAVVDAAFLKSTGDGIDASAETLAHVVGKVGSSTVSYGEVLRKIGEASGSGPRRRATFETKERVAWRLLDARVLERAALQRGLDRHPDVVAALPGATRLVLSRAFVERVSQQVARPAGREIEARYRERRDDFWVPAHRSCLVLDAPTETDANQLRSRLVAGEPVEELAGEYADPKAPPHALGPVRFTDAELDAMASDQSDQHVFAWTIRRARSGEWTPVESQGRWHLVRCEAHHARHRRSLAEVRPEIATAIHQQRVGTAIDARVVALRKRIAVRVLGPGGAPRTGRNSPVH